MIKRLIALVLCLLFVLSLAACGGEKKGDEEDNEGTFNESSITLPDYKPTSDKVTLLGVSDPLRYKNPAYWEYGLNEKLKVAYGVAVEPIVATGENLSTRAAQMVLANQSPDLIIYRAKDDPTFIQNNIVQPVDDLFSFDEPVFKHLKEINEQFRYKDGKLYTFVRTFKNSGFTYYWTADLQELGLATPRELYYKGEWTWSKFEEYARALTIKGTDGTISRYGATYGHYIHTITGQTLVNYKDGVYSNNLRSPELADFFNKTAKLTFEEQVVEPTASAETSFKSHKVSMAFATANMVNNVLLDEQKNGLVSFAPLPKWDTADKYYAPATYSTTWIAKGAPNLDGARAYVAIYTLLVGGIDPVVEAQINALSEATKGYSEEDYAMFDEMYDNTKFSLVQIRDEGIGVNWSSGQRSTMLTNVMRWNKPWASEIETYYPLLNAAIQETK